MDEQGFFRILLGGWFVLSAVIFVRLFFQTAAYGKHKREGWGPGINPKPAWVIMEIPTVVLMIALFIAGDNKNAVAIVFLCLWQFHYLYRTFLFPALMRGKKKVPLMIITFGFIFNLVNVYINGRYLFTFSKAYDAAWFTDIRFIIGVCIFFTGFVMHTTSDSILRNLRKSDDTGYQIPRGGLFRWISCPNYAGEMTAWLGFAVATWSLPALAFFVWTFANLFPRTLSHHRWYKEHFPDYPKDRKAVIPHIL